MDDSIFVIFIAFGCLWLLVGVAALVAFFKNEQQEIRLGKEGLIVAVPILIPLIITLVYAAVRH